MEVMELRPGLTRWTAPHPEWKPERDVAGGWGRMVGCLYYEPSESAGSRCTVLIDPLAPPVGTPDADRFWKSLDVDLQRRGGSVAVLLTNHYHERHARSLRERYGAGRGLDVWSHEAARPRVACEITRTFSGRATLPGGTVAFPIAGMVESETAFWIPEHRALVFGDAVIGTGSAGEIGTGSVRVAPRAWAPDTPEARRRYDEEFRPSLRRLLDLPVEMLLVSHGVPITAGGADLLRAALESPAWGD